MGLVPAVLFHAALFFALAHGFRDERATRPLLERDAFMVSAVTLPKSKGLPDKAAAPRPAPKGEQGKVVPDEPVRPDEMVLRDKETEAKKGEQKKTEKKEEPKKPSREDLLAVVDEVADEPRFATSEDGSEDADPREALLARFGKELSPWQRQVRDAIQKNWFPRSSSGPAPDSLWSAISLSVSEDGTLSAPDVEAGSGDFVFDQSCLRAVARTGQVAPPPPDEPREVVLKFSPKDKR